MFQRPPITTRTYTLSPTAAHCRSPSAEPIVRMAGRSGAISLTDGPATIAAEHAQYNMDSETVTVPGTVLVKGADGYSIDAQGVAVDLKTRSLTGDGGVAGTLNIGRFSANALYADLDERKIGRAHV